MADMTVEEISAAVADWAAGEQLIRRVYLFGSRAKGCSRPDSDADLAILHQIDPEVRDSCDAEVAHMLTWMEYKEGWTSALQQRLSVKIDLQQVDRDSRKVVVPALKACRICLYRKVG
jgi:predicted nucleotidyltransferase